MGHADPTRSRPTFLDGLLSSILPTLLLRAIPIGLKCPMLRLYGSGHSSMERRISGRASQPGHMATKDSSAAAFLIVAKVQPGMDHSASLLESWRPTILSFQIGISRELTHCWGGLYFPAARKLVLPRVQQFGLQTCLASCAGCMLHCCCLRCGFARVKRCTLSDGMIQVLVAYTLILERIPTPSTKPQFQADHVLDHLLTRLASLRRCFIAILGVLPTRTVPSDTSLLAAVRTWPCQLCTWLPSFGAISA